MGRVARAVERIIYWCGANLGYDQGNRWDIREGGECDCSALVYWVLWEAGLLKKPKGDLYQYELWSGTLRRDLEAAGWTAVKPDGHPRKGDVLLNEANHAAMWTGKGVAQASGDERGGIVGGKGGDQTGDECFVTSGYYDYPWDWYMRPPDEYVLRRALWLRSKRSISNSARVRRLRAGASVLIVETRRIESSGRLWGKTDEGLWIVLAKDKRYADRS